MLQPRALTCHFKSSTASCTGGWVPGKGLLQGWHHPSRPRREVGGYPGHLSGPPYILAETLLLALSSKRGLRFTCSEGSAHEPRSWARTLRGDRKGGSVQARWNDRGGEPWTTWLKKDTCMGVHPTFPARKGSCMMPSDLRDRDLGEILALEEPVPSAAWKGILGSPGPASYKPHSRSGSAFAKPREQGTEYPWSAPAVS